MKIVNIILSILILLLAIASAVFSYFLYEKRTQFIDGWNKLTAAIYQSSSAMDQESGTTVAQGLDKKQLAHVNYKSLDKNLATFLSQGTAIIAQRNQMADILFRIGNKVGAPTGAKSEFTKIATYSGRIEAVNTAVADVIRNRDNNYKKLVSIAQSNGVKLNVENLKNGDDQALAPLSSGLNDQRQAKENYRAGLRNIASRVGAKVSLSDSSSKNDASTVLTAVDTKIREVELVAQKLDAANKTISSLNRQLAQNQEKFDTVSKALADQNVQIANFKRALGIEENAPAISFWQDGSKEARAHLAGKVTEVSEDYGYIVIDLGTKSTVMQKIGKKSKPVNLKLAPGIELSVVRGIGNPEFIAAISLDKVGDTESTANIPAKAKKIQVGDTVIAK